MSTILILKYSFNCNCRIYLCALVKYRDHTFLFSLVFRHHADTVDTNGGGGYPEPLCTPLFGLLFTIHGHSTTRSHIRLVVQINITILCVPTWYTTSGMKWRYNSTLTVQTLDNSRWNRSEKSSVIRKIFNLLHSLSVNDCYHIKVSMRSAIFININFLVSLCTYNDLEARSGWPTSNYVPLSAIS